MKYRRRQKSNSPNWSEHWISDHWHSGVEGEIHGHSVIYKRLLEKFLSEPSTHPGMQGKL